jgi:hypothetical protein
MCWPANEMLRLQPANQNRRRGHSKQTGGGGFTLFHTFLPHFLSRSRSLSLLSRRPYSLSLSRSLLSFAILFASLVSCTFSVIHLVLRLVKIAPGSDDRPVTSCLSVDDVKVDARQF